MEIHLNLELLLEKKRIRSFNGTLRDNSWIVFSFALSVRIMTVLIIHSLIILSFYERFFGSFAAWVRSASNCSHQTSEFSTFPLPMSVKPSSSRIQHSLRSRPSSESSSTLKSSCTPQIAEWLLKTATPLCLANYLNWSIKSQGLPLSITLILES